MKLYHFNKNLLLWMIIPAMMSCHNFPETFPGNGNNSNHKVRFCHISDPHYFSPELLIKDGPAFQTYLLRDRKMLAESKAILESAISVIGKEKPKFVMISGDLTKDGEKKGHIEMAAYLSDLEKAGIKVYVSPGNHDINNPHAMSFDGDQTFPVENVNPDEFRAIYGKFGYDEAIYNDPNSLSYVACPVKGVWVLSIDACRYRENTENPVVSGQISSGSLEWIKDRLSEADCKGIRVFAMMHHGMVEHFTGQKDLFPEYVLNDWENVADELSLNGLNYIFTGHFHAQDVVKRSTNDGFIFDIETGSLVSYPSPVRVIDYYKKNDKLNINTEFIESIDYDLGGIDFPEYAYNFRSEGLDYSIPYMLYFVPQDQIPLIAPAVKEAFLAHYSGDEGTPSQQSQAIIDMLMSGDPMMQMLGGSIMNVFNDSEPADNNLWIDMTD